jgi:hypothetical protein
MTAFSFQNSPYKIRTDISSAYREYWHCLAQAGSWWSGAERVAIAREVRNATQCDYCSERKKALSPYQFPGTHQESGTLPSAAVDAVHRVITDQNRITQAYVENCELSEEQYVELVGVAVTVFSIDESMRALGVALEPLPEPVEGEPDHYRPIKAKRDVGFVAMIPFDGAVGVEKDLWKAGQTAHVLRALSLVPNAVREWYRVGDAQYLSVSQMKNLSGPTGRALDRRQIELVAGRISACSECFY